MPHMAPIMWSTTLLTSISLILVVMAMLYFNFFLEHPSSSKSYLYLGEQNWEW